MRTLGLGKTLFNSSVCYLDSDHNAEIILTERITRKKSSGAWPAEALQYLLKNYELDQVATAENRDVEDPIEIENSLNKNFPFYESLKKNGLLQFSRLQNKNIQFITHHYAHACAATFMSPYKKALILVIDGAGSKAKSFNETHLEKKFISEEHLRNDSAEERTVYSLENGHLVCLEKNWQTFKRSSKHPEHFFSEGLGTLYEKASELIFNSKTSAGKVMGLASFAKSSKIENSIAYLENLDWSKKFLGQTKQDWQNSLHQNYYQSVAADVQNYFEYNLLSYIEKLKRKYPDYNHLILAGGCALNCTTNMKIANKKLFAEVYVSPFPGDESIGLGTAYSQQATSTQNWTAFSYEKQHGYFGPRKSIPNDQEIEKTFSEFEIMKPNSIVEFASELLAQEKIIAWFQGRSESGPRALGNRSILASPLIKDLKNRLNTEIKFRESFRPYGCSTLFEKSHTYFEVPEGFNNPYMSFAVHVKEKQKEILKEVMHIDGTSRMQTVRPSQNQMFYELIKSFGNKTNLFCLLNTSLNIMGEPIVESLADAKKFLNRVPVAGLVIGNYYVKKND